MKKIKSISEFDVSIKNKMVIVEFMTNWCNFCKTTEKNLLSMIDEDKDIQVIKVDIELFESLAETLGVFSVPTLIYFKEGKEVKRVSGMQSVESLLKFIR